MPMFPVDSIDHVKLSSIGDLIVLEGLFVRNKELPGDANSSVSLPPGRKVCVTCFNYGRVDLDEF